VLLPFESEDNRKSSIRSPPQTRTRWGFINPPSPTNILVPRAALAIQRWVWVFLSIPVNGYGICSQFPTFGLFHWWDPTNTFFTANAHLFIRLIHISALVVIQIQVAVSAVSVHDFSDFVNSATTNILNDTVFYIRHNTCSCACYLIIVTCLL
jgi:hypothetical protein